MKNALIALFLIVQSFSYINSQELYVFSEPASNMPAKSVSVRFTGKYPLQQYFTQRYVPEVMLGINKHWMVHFSMPMSDIYSSKLKAEAARTYVKYRFYSSEDVHTHFRMAAFADIAYSANKYVYQEPNLEGDNSGYQFGLIATQLVHKLAVSSTIAYTGIFAMDKNKVSAVSPAYKFINYSLSSGYLILPYKYVNYKQLNLNLYVEMMGVKSVESNLHSFDIAPAVQFIFNSNSKINIGYRLQLYSNMQRMANNSFQITFEHTFFNLWK